MPESKLQKVLKALNLLQRRELVVFMKMQRNKLSKRDQALLENLFLASQKNKDFSEESFWLSNLKKSELDSKNKIKTRLLNTIERYLTMNALDQTPKLKGALLSEVYLKLSIEKNTTAQINKTNKLLASPKKRDHTDAFIQFWVAELEAQGAKGRRERTDKIIKMEQALEIFYSLQKLRILCEKANRNNIIQEYSQILEEEGENWKNSQSEDVRIYYHILKMIIHKDEAAFLFVEKYINQHQVFLSSTYFSEVIEYLMNFCILNINRGRKDFAQSYLKFIEVLEKNNQLLVKEGLTASRYTNCILASIIGEKIGWMKLFSKKYASLIEAPDEESKQAIQHYNQGIIALHLNNFDQCFESLSAFQASKVYFKDVYRKIACDKMILKAYYQKNEKIAVENRLESVAKYIKLSDKLSEERKQVHINFLSLLRLKLKEKPVAIEALEHSLLLLDYWWLKNIE